MKTKFKIKGYIDNQGNPRFKVYKKSFLFYHKLFFDVLYDNCIDEEELIFITPKDAEEFIKDWCHIQSHYRVKKVAKRSIGGKYKIKYIPKSNIRGIYSSFPQIKDRDLIYDDIKECLSMDSYLKKTWIEKYFEI